MNEIIDESDIIGDHRIWKSKFVALRDESVPVNNVRIFEEAPRRLHLKRCSSAGDFDLVRGRGCDLSRRSSRSLSPPSNERRSSAQFDDEKAKERQKRGSFLSKDALEHCQGGSDAFEVEKAKSIRRMMSVDEPWV